MPGDLRPQHPQPHWQLPDDFGSLAGIKLLPSDFEYDLRHGQRVHGKLPRQLLQDTMGELLNASILRWFAGRMLPLIIDSAG